MPNQRSPEFSPPDPAVIRQAMASEPLDLSQCDREPVQFTAAIMPHGALLVLSGADGRILGASDNVKTLFGTDVAELLGQSLDVLFSPDTCGLLTGMVASVETGRPPAYLGSVSPIKTPEHFDAFGHRDDRFLMLEFERTEHERPSQLMAKRLDQVNRCLAELQLADNWQAGMALVARTLREISGFDTVIGNRFLADGSFQAVAESRGDIFPSFFDKRFPRSDIPEPGRRQMVLMPMQYAPDLDYEPVPLIMGEDAPASNQLDLGLSQLRSISRVCNQFYLNVGVHSRLVLSIIDQGALWGFFSAWHGSARTIDYTDRLACQLLVQGAAPAMVEKARSEQDQHTLAAKRQMAAIAASLPETGSADSALAGLPARLVDSLDIVGAALCLDQSVIRAGDTPDQEHIQTLLLRLNDEPRLLSNDSLAPALPSSTQPGESLCGLIAARLLHPHQYLLIFRPEWVHEVHWAGDPRKPVEWHDGPGGAEGRLSPRGSFDEWRQEVRGRSRPWQTSEIEAIADLQAALVLWQLSSRKQELLALLESSNAELESFAYAVSHDLQEPLRGIHHYVGFLRESAGQRLEKREQDWMQGLERLSQRMSNQIEALLQYSRLSQQVLEIRPVDLNELLSEVLEDLAGRLAESGVRVDIHAPLPTLEGDPAAIRVVLENLIANGIKYNDKSERLIDIGVLQTRPPTIFVKDNGIGIPPEHHETIFTIFRRLHGRDDYGGGAGAGLTLARKQIQRQGGRLWLESTPGLGTCFYFTLSAGDAIPRNDPAADSHPDA